MKKTSVKKLASILLLLSIGMCSCSKAPAETSAPTEPSEVSNELEQKTIDSMTSEEAMGVLKYAKQSGTHWSAVYDLEKFSVDVCFNIDYDHTYSFEGKRDPL